MQGFTLRKWLAAAALLIGAVLSSALMGFVGGGWKKAALGYVAWALMPYAVLAAAHIGMYMSGVKHSVRPLLGWATAVVALGGPLLYVDAMYWNVDAQGALAVLMIPVVQTALALLVILAAVIWQWGIKRSAADHGRPPDSEALLRAVTPNTQSALMRLARATLAPVIVTGALLYLVIAALQRSDSATIGVAKEVDAFIVQYCESTRKLPASHVLQARFPSLNRETGWYFFTDDKTYLKMQYPVKWWNNTAIGSRRISEFTATPYAYVVEYRC